MHQEYLDSICLYQCYGHPHGFAMRNSPGQTRSGGTCIQTQETATDQRFGY